MRLARRRAIAAVVGAALLSALGAWLVLRRSPVYRSDVLLVLDNESGASSKGDAGMIAKLSGLRGKYADLARTATVLAPAAESLGTDAGQLGDATRTEVISASLLIDVAAETGDAAQAKRFAQAVADTLVEHVRAEMRASDVDPDLRLTMTVVDHADRGDRVAPSALRALTVAAALGLTGLAAGAAAGRFSR
jgi:capsular polysaccharide biosynthesis protein